jgi:hypothetical protein
MRAGIVERADAPAVPRHRTGEPVASPLAFDTELSGRRERIGWVRGIIASLVVALATGLVIGSCALIVGSVEPLTRAAAPAVTETAAVPAPAPAPPAPVAATAAPAPPPVAAVSAAPVAAPPPVRATARVADGDRTLSFVVGVAELHAGVGVNVTVSATGPATDRVQLVAITTAEGASLSSGAASGCDGPAYPWSQTFSIAFPQPESTEIRIQLTSCTGKVLTATSPVDVQP